MCDGDFKTSFITENYGAARMENSAAEMISNPDAKRAGFQHHKSGQGWCSGALGCGNLCETEIAYTGKEIYLTFSSEQINEQATQLKVDDFEGGSQLQFRVRMHQRNRGKTVRH